MEPSTIPALGGGGGGRGVRILGTIVYSILRSPYAWKLPFS